MSSFIARKLRSYERRPGCLPQCAAAVAAAERSEAAIEAEGLAR
ncbi:hypothetical protein C4K10_4225 [Pseudomonas chlororaphis subsp. aureofaciens]|nr:hypothetical protein C4K11_4139 [Pseudomonas chlororaphis subsp. aureofaciens]AZE12496.1 hypothetical protein C4K10_4225 [Pseudomonas chlororaphis subsp. aureofaciens]AZE18475.1 hypothetical protein C4K09_4023 [Pseudomonas chlororaphis subsp. aureofaciens]